MHFFYSANFFAKKIQKNAIFRKITDYFYLCAMIFASKTWQNALILLFALLSVSASAQQQSSALRFLSTTIDLGHIKEEGGVVSKNVEAINDSDDTLYILEVVATCGCTTANYEKKELQPGDTLSLGVQFDPMNRPGRIDKTLFVTASDCKEPLRLHLVGYVQPRERSVEEIYPFDMGEGLKLKSNFHAFSYLEHGKMVEERIGYANTSDKELRVVLQPRALSGHLQMIVPEVVAPKSTGDIILHYALAEGCDVYGVLEDSFDFVVNGLKAYYPFGCQAVAVDNFDNVDDISAPRADISKKIIKFGDVKRHYAILEQSVELINIGSSPLVLRAVASTSEALSVEHGEVEVAAGDSATIVVRLDVRRIEDWDNPFVARLMLITNDPIRPMLSIRVNALPE